ncbi:MAG: histidine kinase dimerization/phospho-acceptor domain-containing protein, partial [Bacteroidota bacterium]
MRHSFRHKLLKWFGLFGLLSLLVLAIAGFIHLRINKLLRYELQLEQHQGEIMANFRNIENMFQQIRHDINFFQNEVNPFGERYEKSAVKLDQEFSVLHQKSTDLSLDLDHLLVASQASFNKHMLLKDSLEQLVLKRGFRNYGLIGGMRDAIHDMERIAREKGDQDLLVMILSLRRREKDYLLRQDLAYISRHQQERESTIELIENSGAYTYTEKKELLRLLDVYGEHLGQVVELDEFLGRNSLQGIRSRFNKAEEEVIATVNETLVVADAKINHTILVFSVCFAVLFGLLAVTVTLLSRTASHKLTAPIFDLSANMNGFIHNGFRDIGLCPIPQSKDEIGQLTTNFYLMVNKIQDYLNELKLKTEAAEAANKSKSQFLANMSHELRTPLNGVIGVIGMLSSSNLNQEQRELVDLLDVSSNNLLGIISDILDFSKIEAGKLELEE